MNTGISEQLVNEIIQLAEKYDIDRVILFGSRARGDYHKTSDIDLAVVGGDITLFSLDVEDKTNTLLKYDIVNLNSEIQIELMESIQREGIVIYEKI